MHIITQKRIWDAKKKHIACATALDGWYRVIKKNTFRNFAEIRKVFNNVDKVDKFYVFNVGGNKIRIITIIHFYRQKVYIQHVLTHKEYDKGKWKK